MENQLILLSSTMNFGAYGMCDNLNAHRRGIDRHILRCTQEFFDFRLQLCSYTMALSGVAHVGLSSGNVPPL